jgi:hypothetical protein
MSEEAGTLCVSCGQPLNGRYCSQCGERALAPDEFALRRFVAETAHDITSADAKLYRSFWLLIRRPGLLTLEYLRGKRVPYLRPIQLFLLANLVYFVVQPYTGYSGFNTALQGQWYGQFYSEPLHIRERVERKVAERGTTMDSYTTAFNRRSSIYARTLTAVMIPLLGLAVALVFAAQRRPLASHFVFATHFMAWQLIVVMSAFLFLLGLAIPYLNAFLEWGSATGLPGMGLLEVLLKEFGSLLLQLPYLYLAVVAVYRTGRLASALGALALTTLLLFVVIAYRFMLFWVTFATV